MSILPRKVACRIRLFPPGSFGRLWETLGDSGGAFGEALGGFGEHWETLGEPLGSLWEALGSFGRRWGSLWGVFGRLWGSFGSLSKPFFYIYKLPIIRPMAADIIIIIIIIISSSRISK